MVLVTIAHTFQPEPHFPFPHQDDTLIKAAATMKPNFKMEPSDLVQNHHLRVSDFGYYDSSHPYHPMQQNRVYTPGMYYSVIDPIPTETTGEPRPNTQPNTYTEEIAVEESTSTWTETSNTKKKQKKKQSPPGPPSENERDNINKRQKFLERNRLAGMFFFSI